MRAVNLLPREQQQERSDGGRLPLLVAGAGLAALTAAFGVLFFSASASVSEQQAALDSVEAAIDRIPKPDTPAVASKVIAQERSARSTAISAALSTRVPVDRLLEQLAYVLPDDAWLISLSAAAPASQPVSALTPTTTTPGVSITGATYSQSSVARVLARLAAMPTLVDVRLTGSTRVPPRTVDGEPTVTPMRTVVTFTISANLRTEGVS